MSGPLRLVPREAGALPNVPMQRQRRRPSWAEDPLEELAERLAEVCAAAVHADEIAAVLESDGLTHELIVNRYGRRDLFALAEELHERSADTRRYPEPAPGPDPWRIDPWRCVLRGIVFGLPGLAYVLGGTLLKGPSDAFGLPAGTVALSAAALVGWAWNQALAHRAYLRFGSDGRRSAAHCLLRGAPAGALLASAVAIPFASTGSQAAFAVGQSGYLAAATALLVLGRERDLLLALAPTTAGAAALLMGDLPAWARACLVITTPVAALLIAGRQIVRGMRTPPEPGEPAPPPVAASVPYGLYGLASAVLVLVLALDAGVSAVSLTLSMGAAEWLLYRFRGRGVAALRRSTDAAGFQARAALALLGCLTGYLVVLGVLETALTRLWPGAPAPGPLRLCVLLALGAVLWLSLLLQAFGAAWPAAVVCIAAAVPEVAALCWEFGDHPIVQLASCTGAAGLLIALACSLLGRSTAHR
ncbi:hypothetical protein QMK19_31000 [Streptomyces sp. H10-C2]|uniref:hypothetical protein n=1 Tax=unclassified Streptomyces TaxID=2593676 RepID=UPI0024BAD401|nr:MULTISPECIES: hypothetical protein [unclassified Streptomyces]MDJ0344968.1 hypothetical protein [Streptomyces sp. PH10-H1]MDJ0373951.1 hypothetical protein [Streptomyces sp. H10-C2]